MAKYELLMSYNRRDLKEAAHYSHSKRAYRSKHKTRALAVEQMKRIKIMLEKADEIGQRKKSSRTRVLYALIRPA